MLPKIRKKKLEANIWKFYIYRVFSSLIFVIPVFVLFYLDNGLSMTQVMILQSVYSAFIMISVVPAGIVADYVGRKKVLIANALFFMLSWALFALGHNFAQFLIAEATSAISAGLWMASGSAFFYDTLRELGREGSYKRLFGNVVGINNITWGLSSLAGGFIAVYGLRVSFWATVIVCFLALMVTFSFTDTERFKHGDKHYLTHLKEASKFAATHPRIRMLIIYSAIMLAVWFSGFMLYQPYLQSINIPLVYFGFIYFAINMLAAAGSRMADKIEAILGEKKILTILLFVFAVCYLGMSKQLYILGFIFPVVLAFAGGVFDPVLSDYMNKHIESSHRATVLSLQTLLTEFMCTLSAPFFGWIVDFWSLKTAFITAAIILAINLFILIGAFTIIRRRER
jgi:MFS family permease